MGWTFAASCGSESRKSRIADFGDITAMLAQEALMPMSLPNLSGSVKEDLQTLKMQILKAGLLFTSGSLQMAYPLRSGKERSDSSHMNHPILFNSPGDTIP